MTSEITYSEPKPINGHEAFEFEILVGSSPFFVRVSREAVENFASKRGLSSPNSPDELLYCIQTYQPEFVQIACEKRREIETVSISPDDLGD